ARIGPAEGVVPALTDALKDKTPATRQLAASSLGSMGSPGKDAVPALVAALKDDQQLVRQAAVEALARMGPAAKEVAPARDGLLKDPNLALRLQAIEALCQVDAAQAKKAMAALAELLKAREAPVRLMTLDALGRLDRETEAIPLLIETIADKDKKVRYRAIVLLSQMAPHAKDA